MSAISRDIWASLPERNVFNKNTLPNYVIWFYQNGSYSATYQNYTVFIEYWKKVLSIYYTFEWSSGRYVYWNMTNLLDKNVSWQIFIAWWWGSFNLWQIYLSGNTVYVNYINWWSYYSTYNFDTWAVVQWNTWTWSTWILVWNSTDYTASNWDIFSVSATWYSWYIAMPYIVSSKVNQTIYSQVLPQKRRAQSLWINKLVYTGSFYIWIDWIPSSLYEYWAEYNHIRITNNFSKVSWVVKIDHASYWKIWRWFNITLNTWDVASVSDSTFDIWDNIRNEQWTENILIWTNKRYNSTSVAWETWTYTQYWWNQNYVIISWVKYQCWIGRSYWNTTVYKLTIA